MGTCDFPNGFQVFKVIKTHRRTPIIGKPGSAHLFFFRVFRKKVPVSVLRRLLIGAVSLYYNFLKKIT